MILKVLVVTCACKARHGTDVVERILLKYTSQWSKGRFFFWKKNGPKSSHCEEKNSKWAHHMHLQLIMSTSADEPLDLPQMPFSSSNSHTSPINTLRLHQILDSSLYLSISATRETWDQIRRVYFIAELRAS
jgi:hypothetical protein